MNRPLGFESGPQVRQISSALKEQGIRRMGFLLEESDRYSALETKHR